MTRSSLVRPWAVVSASGVGLIGLLTWLMERRGVPGSLLPHGYCFTWDPALLWTQVVSDSLIGVSYVSIPITLLHLVRKRKDVPFDWIVLLFATFIVSCGATHWIEVWTVWHPDYWLGGMVKAITAASSLLTAAALMLLVPRILAIPTLAELTTAKAALELEVAQRRAVEDELRLERVDLEQRVALRTRDLELAIEQARAARAAAEEANLQKDRFLAKVSHELRTPLQSTLSWAQVLRRDDLDPVQAARAADRIVHNVRQQARLIDDLLDISRILSGNLHLDYQAVDVLEVIDRAVDVVRSAAHDKGVSLERVSHLDRAPTLQTDPARLEEVVWNLLSNAVQASASGGRVVLSVDVTDSELQLTVRDTGAGISASDLPHIFEPFRQGGGAPGGHRGLGLGLAIVRHIVTLFDGRVSAASAGLGQGAEFLVHLPLQAVAAPQAGPDADGRLEPYESGLLQGVRVVYVEDEPDIAESCHSMLTSLGMRVEVFVRFADAQRRLQQGGFDLLLTDLNLDAGRTGLDLLHELRLTPHGRDMPALILSAFGSEADRSASRAAGFDDHLVKPLDAQQVSRAILAAMGTRAG